MCVPHSDFFGWVTRNGGGVTQNGGVTRNLKISSHLYFCRHRQLRTSTMHVSRPTQKFWHYQCFTLDLHIIATHDTHTAKYYPYCRCSCHWCTHYSNDAYCTHDSCTTYPLCIYLPIYPCTYTLASSVDYTCFFHKEAPLNTCTAY